MNPRFLSVEKIRWILLIALVVRLVHIDFPVAGFQAWRQADTAAMARNFYDHGFHLLYPEIDWGGGGYVESEFPIYQFAVSLLYGIFSPSDTWGRIVSVVCALFTIYGLFVLVRKFLGASVALWSAFIYAIIPVNIFYTRAFMPESAMLMCSVWGVYLFAEWIESNRYRHFVLSGIFICMAILIKIPALYLGLPLLFLGWTRYRGKTLMQWQLWIYALIVVTPVALWYYHAHQLFLQTGLTFSIWGFGSDKWGIGQPLLTFKWYNDIFFKSIAERHLTYAGFLPFIVGLFIKRETVEERLFDWWLIALMIYFVVVTVGNQVHEYYQLPFILPAVVYIGKTFNRYLSSENVERTWKENRVAVAICLLCLVSIPILSFIRVQHYMQGERIDSSLFHLGDAVHEVTNPTDRVVAVDLADPVVLYRAGRRGWHAFPNTVTDDFLLQMETLGAKYLIGEKGTFIRNGCEARMKELIAQYSVVAEGDDFFIVRLARD